MFSDWQRELNRVLIRFSILLIQLLHGLCTTFPYSSCDPSCDIIWCDAVTSCHVTVTIWHLWCDTFLYSLLCSKFKIKEKKKKRNINHHVSPTRTCLTTPPPLTTSIRPQNPLRPWSFPTALTSQLTPTCRTATSQPLHCSAQMNSCKVISATWLAHYNGWHAFSNSKVWKGVTVTTSPNWNYSANQLGSSYLRFSNLAGTNYTHLKTSPSATTFLPILEIYKPAIRPPRTMPTPKWQW